MQILENVSLADYSTMRLGGLAHYLAEVHSEEELLEALSFAENNNLPIHISGSGSNTIFTDNGFSGLMIINKITGVSEEEQTDEIILTVSAGEVWDDIVRLSVEKGFIDIAALSLIPGTAGAAPVQNIGAYGQQVSDSLISVRGYDLENREFTEISKENCDFGYRKSRFNTNDKNRFIITSIKLRLNRNKVEPPFYADVEKYFEENGIDKNNVTPAELRKAVSTVRVIKLPDPSEVSNSGSFFKNPIISQQEFDQLKVDFPELKAHQTDDGSLKLYGGQLIDLAGLKDYHDVETGMATWKNQALVLVNEAAKSTRDLLAFKQKIVKAVEEKFGITLVQEPEIIEA